MPKPNSITAVILCKNAQPTLERVISSVSFCDHVLLADDGSTDRSIEVAKKLEASILKLQKNLNFSQKRNQALEYVSTPWVFFIDPDEWVSPALAKEMTDLLNTNRIQEYNGYEIKRVDLFMGRELQYGETGDMWLLRLGSKDQGTWRRAVHEVWEIQPPVRRLKGELYHDPHKDIASFLEKINRYTSIEAESRIKNPHFALASRGRQELSIQTKFSFFILYTSYLFQLFLYPPGKFLFNFIIKQGFRDGFPGFVMAYMMSLHSLCVRIKVLENLRKEGFYEKSYRIQ